ncbi:MAG: type II toxin-antitoxin system YhaV family toxin [Symploca sp. SIO1B1]|nr:type II toxin-antitoxin system YhaV family toxin [Symploca sp. SIO1B1]
MSNEQPIVINEWNIFAHPCFLRQVEALVVEVEQLSQKYPENYKQKNATKRLAAIAKLAFKVIPQDPTRQEYRQGTTLGDDYKHWFRAKFYQQYRLFFQYRGEDKIIVFGWVNDTQSKRSYESKTDAYCVFRKMLDAGYPPNNWETLVEEAMNESSHLSDLAKNIQKFE